MNPLSPHNRFVLAGLVHAYCFLLLPKVGAADTPPVRTTLSNTNIQFTVLDKPYVVLRRGPLQAVVVDNRAVDDAVLPGHRAGYHGVASLMHSRQARNVFVPAYAGLNFEHIHDGTTQANTILFEPRHAPMQLRKINDFTAELHQPPTPHWGLESCQRYELLEDGVIELTFECIPRRVTWKNDYLGLFWASYIHQPASGAIHFLKPRSIGTTEWVRSTTPRHGVQATHRIAGDERDFGHDADFPLSLVFNFSPHHYAEPWYWGECRGMVLSQLFRASDQVRFSQSPSGGGEGNPAWDFQWFIPQPKVGQLYRFAMRAMYFPLPEAVDETTLRKEIRQAITTKRFDAAAANSAVSTNNVLGLAAKYRGDAGIDRDPHVLFADNFETGDLPATEKRWSQMSNKDGKVMALSDDVPSASAGKRSLQMTATLGENTGGHLYKSFPPGADKVYARFYVKFAPDADYIHHFVTMGGYYPPTAWPQGGAGERPRGAERFTAGIEPYGNYGRYAAPGAWNFYTYWHEMKGSADGKYWGNGLKPAQPALVPRDRWQCVEIMEQCNSAPDKSDGALALWLDGQPVAHFGPGSPRDRWTGMGFSLVKQDGEPFEGFRWRTDSKLKINFFWLLHYVTENAGRQNRMAKPNPINRVWFDDIVVSTEYIGPIQP